MLCRRILNLIPLQVQGTRVSFHDYSNNKVTITDDGTTIVALHPPPDFPYELSQPLSEKQAPSGYLGPLKNASSDVLRLLKTEKPEEARKRLAAITMTCEHRWFPKGRFARRRKPKDEPERPYL